MRNTQGSDDVLVSLYTCTTTVSYLQDFDLTTARRVALVENCSATGLLDKHYPQSSRTMSCAGVEDNVITLCDAVYWGKN